MKPKILILTPRFPYPVVGGDRLRIFEICKELSKYYDLTLLSFCESKSELKLNFPTDSFFKEVHRVYHPRWKSIIGTIRSLFTGEPLQTGYYHSHIFKNKVESLAQQHSLVLCHLIRTSKYISESNFPKVLEMTDAISMNYSRFDNSSIKSGFMGIVYRFEKARLLKYERQMLDLFDITCLVSDVDREYFLPLPNGVYEKTLVCSNGVDLSKYVFEHTNQSKKLVFIGNMCSVQNFDAALWFASEVLPCLRHYDQYEFVVIGKISDDSKCKLASIDGVSVTGPVDDVGRYARGALAGICSVRLAAGVQNKILEYMALGIPTITSSIGLEGLQALPNHQILVADSCEEYLQHITKLRDDVQFSQSLANNAYEYVKQNHQWTVKLQPLVDSISHLVKK